MYGARVRPVLPPHRAARQDRERRVRPRRRLRHPPARPADERLADRDPRSRLAVLAGTVRRVGGPEHEPMPAGRDRPTGQDRPRRGRRARRTGRRRWRSGPCHRPMRATRPSCPVARRHGRGTRPPGREGDGRDAAGARGRGSWPPSPMITAPGVPGVVSVSVPPPPNGVRGATRGYCQVDEKLVDRPPRYWARARREPAILGIKNGRRPQLDNTLPLHREEPPRDPRRRRDEVQIDLRDDVAGETVLGLRPATQRDGSCQPCGSDAPVEHVCPCGHDDGGRGQHTDRDRRSGATDSYHDW